MAEVSHTPLVRLGLGGRSATSWAMRRSTWTGICMCAAIAVSLATVTPAQGELGVESFENKITNSSGLPATQAGSHPYSMTTTLVLKHQAPTSAQISGGIRPNSFVPDNDAKSLEFNLPAGFVANPIATTTKCPESELLSTGKCFQSSQVGVASISLGVFEERFRTPVYNMETPSEAPAELGINVEFEGLAIHILGKVRTAGDYGISAEVPDVNQQVAFWAAQVTLWGDPSSASHDAERGICLEEGKGRRCPVERTERPFLTMPSSCGSPLMMTMTGNSWQEPGSFILPIGATSNDAEGTPTVVTGCEKLNFNPQISVQPTTHAADSPSGLSVEMSLPQEESLTGLAEADLKEAVVTLPTGMSVSPSAADGDLGACTPQEIGLGTALSPTCPESSKIGSMEVHTPLLEQPLVGSVYLAQQTNNPFGSLIALYLVAEARGVVFKIPGEVRLDPTTGQLTTRFGEDPITKAWIPELPFSRLKLDFFGGPRAALVTPSACGTYTTTSSLTPWSAPESGPSATPSWPIAITEHCEGGQFRPTIVSGTVNNQAGAFSPLTFTGFREDTEQNISRIQVTTPPGVLGVLSGIPLCGETQANRGVCEPGSLIGHVTVGVGAGPDPLYVTGEVFLTGPYRGAPFGLSVVVPAVAGPFDLGTVVVRAAININPHTAAVTITSDPLPQILDGIPVQIRIMHVIVDRLHFILNPTNCSPLLLTATLSSPWGATTSPSARFQASNCATLAFSPKFTASTSGHTSKADGASLDTKLVYPRGPMGSEANIAKVKVELPKRLPARLKTLQKACAASTFEVNPANCPAASVIGIVKSTTPILPVQLTGPVYFVSHGGEAFPDVVIVLEGDGVRVDLTAATFISKKGITSSTFRNIPDVPVSSFELYLPEDGSSALAANGNLCKGGLKMPTIFIAQNGAEIHQSTPIVVTGCARGKKIARNAKKIAQNAHSTGKTARRRHDNTKGS